jgi:hypothetical protein
MNLIKANLREGHLPKRKSEIGKQSEQRSNRLALVRNSLRCKSNSSSSGIGILRTKGKDSDV